MYACAYRNRLPLAESALLVLPLGAVKPRGWLRRQLEVQATGQTGHLPEFWESLNENSGWLGGTGESWERGPYYLDGLVPLAYLLDDDRLIGIVEKWMGWILNSQDAVGHFGPSGLADWWPYGPVLKAITQHHEATESPLTIPLLERFFAYMRRDLALNRLHTWSKMRWADTVLSVAWLYNRNSDPELLDLAAQLMAQGYDWAHHFTDFPHTQKQSVRFPMRTHVVNTAMGIKTPAVQYLLTGWEELRRASWTALQVLDEFHGQATGIFTGDEHLAGKSPTQGAETCAVVETMFSLEFLMSMFADPAFGDRLERIAYNALPGAFSADTWQHQYDQQANQVLCTIARRRWTNNGDDANLFGLEPNFGCCTANQHQGWPKFVQSLWMATPDGGLAATAYGPCEVKARCRGADVRIEVDTEYPFDDTVRMTVHTSAPVTFPLSLRIPGWTSEPTLDVLGARLPAEPGSFARVEREWSDGDTVTLTLPMSVRAERRFNDALTLHRGPLVYSLRVGERWERIRGADPCPDYAVHPTTPWNYSLAVDPERPEAIVERHPIGDMIFSPDPAPIELRVKGRLVPEWGIIDNQAADVPQNPVTSDAPEEELVFVPYGCAKLRMTELPILA